MDGFNFQKHIDIIKEVRGLSREFTDKLVDCTGFNYSKLGMVLNTTIYGESFVVAYDSRYDTLTCLVKESTQITKKFRDEDDFLIVMSELVRQAEYIILKYTS